MTGRLLLLVASGGGGVEHRLRAELAEPAVRRGWRLAVTLTPTAGRWFEATGEWARLQAVTDLPVRSAARLPTEPKPYPTVDCCIFAPATANSLAKLALGMCDNQAITQACEVMGTPGSALVVRPQASAPYRAHPAFAAHLAALRSAGVYVDDVAAAESPWEPLLDIADALLDARP